MMRWIRPYWLISLLFIFIGSCSNSDDTNGSGNGELQRVFTLGGSKNERAESIIKTLDGGFAILGYTQSMDGDVENKTDESFDYWMLKYSAQKTLEWSRTFGGTGNDRGRDLVQTNDGGYALIGSSSSNDGDVTGNAGQLDFWLVKLDPSGAILWQKSFGFSGNDEGTAIIETNDLGFLITGVIDVTSSGGEGNTGRAGQRHAGGDYWAIKTDTSGNLEWSRYYGGNFTDTPEGLAPTSDNGFIIAGGSDSEDTDIFNNIGTYDFWLTRISSTGELVWERSLGGTEIDEARAIVPSNDGNYFIVGDTRSSDVMVSDNNGAADIWLIKITPSGNLIWERNFGGSNFDAATDVYRVSDGLLIAGNSRSANGDVNENKGQNDIWILKVDFNGVLQWEKSIGGSNIDLSFGVTALNDGTIIAVGDASSDDGDLTENKGFTDLILVEIND